MNLLVLGGGNMTRALIGGLVRQPQPPLTHLQIIEPLEAAREQLQALLADDCARAGIALQISETPTTSGPAPDWLLLAVKPQVAVAAMAGLRQQTGDWLAETRLLSIAAGLSHGLLQGLLPGREAGSRVVRSMPNTPALIGQGITGLFATAEAAPAIRQEAELLLQGAGPCVWVEDEGLMDAVTALSGSGPAYVFRFAEGLMAGGEALGLRAEAAQALTIQTLLGAAAMLQQAGEPAGVLRQRVTSPGGTTAAALAVLDEGDLVGLIGRALAAARDRGQSLSADAERAASGHQN